MKYLVRITETSSRTVIVEADNMQDAERKVNNAYYDEKIVLDYDDFDEYEIKTIREAVNDDKMLYDVLEVEEWKFI